MLWTRQTEDGRARDKYSLADPINAAGYAQRIARAQLRVGEPAQQLKEQVRHGKEAGNGQGKRGNGQRAYPEWIGRGQLARGERQRNLAATLRTRRGLIGAA